MREDLLINTSGFVLNILEKILNANIEIKGVENIPKNNPRIFVANHFTRMEAMIVPYALYNLTNKKVGVIADDSLFETYFGTFLKNLGAMRKSEPNRDQIIFKDLLTAQKDWMIFPEGRMVKAKDISKAGNHYCVKIDGVCQKVHTGSSYFAIESELLREDYFSNKIKNIKKFKRKYFFNKKDEICQEETMVIPINISYSKIRNGENFLTNMAIKFLDNIGKHFLEELEIEGNLVLNSKITVQILKPISMKNILKDIYEKELNHNNIFSKYRYQLTYKFMEKIYENLTVNFDHIFALILFLYPKKDIKKELFKRLIYLSVNEIKKNCLTYDSILNQNMINLISFEKYKPFEEILNIAIKDGIIVEQEDKYIIKKSNLLDSYTHHTIRLKNILRVILNEILIINKVKLIVKQLILQSEDTIDKKIFELLKIEEIYEFENDRVNFLSEAKTREIGQPFLFESEKSDECVIALHGFSSAPKEVYNISKYLHKKGFNVYAPRLRGHGTSPKDLKQTTWQQWYESVSRAITIASLKYKKIHILGFSTGGLLALLSTKKNNSKIKSIICINAALNLKDIRLKTLLPTISFWNDLVEAFNANKYAKEFVDNFSENPTVNYDKHYIDSIEQLDELMHKTKKSLQDVKIPIYIVQAKDDPVVNPISAYEIYDKIQSTNKELLILDLDRHIIINGNDTYILFDKIYNFLKKQGNT